MDPQQFIKETIEQHHIVLFMKGTKLMPMCGFSARVVEILNEYGVDFKDVNVLEDESIRQGIKDFSDWPTIPQIYVDQKFIGGCDIVTELHYKGELKDLL